MGDSPACLPLFDLAKAGAFTWDRWTHVAVTIDTSRDESSASVKLFLDGCRKAQGICRFNKVSLRGGGVHGQKIGQE